MPTLAQRIDPTGTLTLRRQYEAAMLVRFRALIAALRSAIIQRDVFGLDPVSQIRFAKDAPIAASAFAGLTQNEEKANAFVGWLRKQASEGILGVELGTPVESASLESWQNLYVRRAYTKGERDGTREVRSAEGESGGLTAGFNRPIQAQRAGVLYARNFEALRGITEAMADDVRDVLTRGLIEGRGPRELADTLSARVRAIGVTRARTLVRTEVISAHAKGVLAVYEEAGVREVTGRVEWLATQDDRVCPECEALNGRVYDLDSAQGLIPLHPNCRCTWIPVVR